MESIHGMISHEIWGFLDGLMIYMMIMIGIVYRDYNDYMGFDC